MRKNSEITSKDFKNLLDRFSSDGERAGEKYEMAREGLIRYFYYRGCFDPESLADETINRAAARLSGVSPDEKFALHQYFYSFAANIYLEELRKRKKQVSIDADFLKDLSADAAAPDAKKDVERECMESCLASRAPAERSLLLKYYGFGKSERAEQRKIMAAELNISVDILHTKISRLRNELRNCLKNCLKGK